MALCLEACVVGAISEKAKHVAGEESEHTGGSGRSTDAQRDDFFLSRCPGIGRSHGEGPIKLRADERSSFRFLLWLYRPDGGLFGRQIFLKSCER